MNVSFLVFYGAPMIEIIKCGLIESDNHLLQIARECGQIVVPENDDLDLTHWWLLRDNGVETIYVGTPGTFDVYVMESNGGLQ